MPLEDNAVSVWDVMGQNEHMAYMGDTFEFANSVTKVIQVEEFLADTASLHVLSESAHYSRKNVALCLPLGSTRYSLIAVSDTLFPRSLILPSPVQGSRDLVCKANGCQHLGLYRPDTDILRWCQFCYSWYHVGCLKAVAAKGPTLPKADPERPEQWCSPSAIEKNLSTGRIVYDYHNFTLWRQLLKLPVQRGYVGHGYPLSFELLTLEIRKTAAATGCPADVRNFVLEHLSPAPGLAHHSHELVTPLYASLTMPSTYYQCPTCEQEVVI